MVVDSTGKNSLQNNLIAKVSSFVPTEFDLNEYTYEIPDANHCRLFYGRELRLSWAVFIGQYKILKNSRTLAKILGS